MNNDLNSSGKINRKIFNQPLSARKAPNAPWCYTPGDQAFLNWFGRGKLLTTPTKVNSWLVLPTLHSAIV